MAERAVPILPSRDLRETLVFYERLGFENVHVDAGYAVVRRGDIWLHFFDKPDIDPLTTIAGCYVYVHDADAVHGEWAAVVAPDPPTGSRITPPENTDYGLREFAVVDRSGNLLRVGSFLDRG